MFFTDRGRCYRIKIYDLPEGSRTAKGRSLANVIQKDPDEKVTAFLAIKEFVDDHFIFFTTQKGKVKRVRLSEFESVRVTGKIAISLDDDDKLLAVNLTTGSSHIIIGTRNGMACHFKEKGVRTMGRTAAGVRGIRLAKDDIVVAMVVVNDPEKEQILVVAELGYGKRSPIIVADDDVSDGDTEDIVEDTVETTDESTSDGDGEEEIEVDNRKFVFRLTNRGGKGVRSMKVTEKTGKVVSMLPANDDLDLIVISENGIIIRQEMKKINIIGRNTQGVRLIRLDAGDRISDITTILHEEEEEIIDEATVVETTIPTSENPEPTQNVEGNDDSVSE
jgi:DNA gyrase subunit A